MVRRFSRLAVRVGASCVACLFLIFLSVVLSGKKKKKDSSQLGLSFWQGWVYVSIVQWTETLLGLCVKLAPN